MDALVRRPYSSATSPEAIERFTTSWILPPVALFAWRASVSVYAFVVLFTILGYDDSHGDSKAAGESFSYFTVLGYWGAAFYYAFAAAHTASYWLYGTSWLQKWPRALQWAHSCYYSTVTTFPFIVTIVFWTILSGGALATQFSTWSNISEHALNSVFAALEIILPRTNPSPWINLVVVIVLLALYLALAELAHATQGYYVYSFLDPSWLGNGVVGAACVGILIGTSLVFILVRYLVLLRKLLTETVFGMTGNFSTRVTGLNRGSHDNEMGHVQMEVIPVKGHQRTDSRFTD